MARRVRIDVQDAGPGQMAHRPELEEILLVGGSAARPGLIYRTKEDDHEGQSKGGPADDLVPGPGSAGGMARLGSQGRVGHRSEP